MVNRTVFSGIVFRKPRYFTGEGDYLEYSTNAALGLFDPETFIISHNRLRYNFRIITTPSPLLLIDFLCVGVYGKYKKKKKNHPKIRAVSQRDRSITCITNNIYIVYGGGYGKGGEDKFFVKGNRNNNNKKI